MGRGRGTGRGTGSGAGRGGGRGPGRQGGSAVGPGGNCICPSCGHRQAHRIGVPCLNEKCPKCGAQMIREIR
jgi:hypothetical protein